MCKSVCILLKVFGQGRTLLACLESNQSNLRQSSKKTIAGLSLHEWTERGHYIQTMMVKALRSLKKSTTKNSSHITKTAGDTTMQSNTDFCGTVIKRGSSERGERVTTGKHENVRLHALSTAIHHATACVCSSP
jgi:hypothetical protein